MKMPKNDPWIKLADTVRQANYTPQWPLPQEAPLGFHSRVLSRLGGEMKTPTLLALKLTLRAIPFGVTLLLACWLLAPLASKTMQSSELDLTELVFEEVLP